MDKKLVSSTTLDVHGNLNLSSINFPKFSSVTASEELNDYLRDQLHQMKLENEALQEKVSIKTLQNEQDELKIQELSEKITSYESCCGSNEFMSSTQLANSKIIELSKKLREKNSEIETYKSKCLKHENMLSELKAKSEQSQPPEKQENSPPDVDEIKKLQDKLTHVTSKWTEEKNLNLQLKKDLKMANKWLIQEIGEKFENLVNLNNGGSNWRGRAQIICDLQQKNQELREKLKYCQDNFSNSDVNLVKCDNKKLETLNKENTELKNNYLDTKRKFDVLKARCKVLENEYTFFKTKLSNLSETHDEDQHTIAKLTSQVSHFNELKNEDLKQKDQIIKNLHEENEALRIELAREKCVSENKSKQLLEKNDDIKLLNKRIRSSRPSSSYVHRPENPETRTINKLKVERLRLLELTELQSSRLEQERNTHFKTQQQLRQEKQKRAKLEANLARLQLEQSSARSGYASRMNTPKQPEYDLQDKLELAEENIKALSTRLEIESMERKHDLEKFCNTLKNCTCN
ncbi:hypothetical protein Zmor_020509 [Zophobas morio]|uniref:Coiled-coil domain-containing protein 13 n=1 Tax=Zophobas morio TaxID=2755281 RepID=A0AA38I3F9_9CUCU|nr:hypothetical protein Zmor_020509 [Zophobas morio]